MRERGGGGSSGGQGRGDVLVDDLSKLLRLAHPCTYNRCPSGSSVYAERSCRDVRGGTSGPRKLKLRPAGWTADLSSWPGPVIKAVCPVLQQRVPRLGPACPAQTRGLERETSRDRNASVESRAIRSPRYVMPGVVRLPVLGRAVPVTISSWLPWLTCLICTERAPLCLMWTVCHCAGSRMQEHGARGDKFAAGPAHEPFFNSTTSALSCSSSMCFSVVF